MIMHVLDPMEASVSDLSSIPNASLITYRGFLTIDDYFHHHWR